MEAFYRYICKLCGTEHALQTPAMRETSLNTIVSPDCACMAVVVRISIGFPLQFKSYVDVKRLRTMITKKKKHETDSKHHV